MAVTLDELHVEVLGPAGEQFDEPGGGVLGEQAGGGQAQQPASLARLAHLPDGPVLKAEQLARPAGQPQPSGCKRQSVVRPGEKWSSSSGRNWPMCSDTAASVTPSSAAASFTEPRLTTARKARSWVGVTRPHCNDERCMAGSAVYGLSLIAPSPVAKMTVLGRCSVRAERWPAAL